MLDFASSQSGAVVPLVPFLGVDEAADAGDEAIAVAFVEIDFDGVAHAGFFHDAAGGGIDEEVLGLDAIELLVLEAETEDLLKCLGGQNQ